MHCGHQCTETKKKVRDGTGSSNLNGETIPAKKKAGDALKVIHGNLYILAYGSVMCC